MKKRMFLRIALAALLSAGLYALAAPAPTAHAAPPTSHTVTHVRDQSAIAVFFFEQGDVSGFAQVTASLHGFPFPPSPISGPAVEVSITEFNNVTNESFVGGGRAAAPGLKISNRLTSATLPEVTVPVAPVDEVGNPIGPSFPVTVDLTWTGVGSITTQTDAFHTHVPHVINETFHFRGTFRDATVEGTVSYPSPLLGTTLTLTGADVGFAQMMRTGILDIAVQR